MIDRQAEAIEDSAEYYQQLNAEEDAKKSSKEKLIEVLKPYTGGRPYTDLSAEDQQKVFNQYRIDSARQSDGAGQVSDLNYAEKAGVMGGHRALSMGRGLKDLAVGSTPHEQHQAQNDHNVMGEIREQEPGAAFIGDTAAYTSAMGPVGGGITGTAARTIPGFSRLLAQRGFAGNLVRGGTMGAIGATEEFIQFPEQESSRKENAFWGFISGVVGNEFGNLARLGGNAAGRAWSKRWGNRTLAEALLDPKTGKVREDVLKELADTIGSSVSAIKGPATDNVDDISGRILKAITPGVRERLEGGVKEGFHPTIALRKGQFEDLGVEYSTGDITQDFETQQRESTLSKINSEVSTARRNQMARQNNQLREAGQDIANDMGDPYASREWGQDIIDKFQLTRNQDQGVAGQNYNQGRLAIEGSGVNMDMTGAAPQINKVYDEMMGKYGAQGKGVLGDVDGLLQQYQLREPKTNLAINYPKEFNIGSAEDVIQQLNALRGNGQDFQPIILRNMKQSVHGVVDDAIEGAKVLSHLGVEGDVEQLGLGIQMIQSGRQQWAEIAQTWGKSDQKNDSNILNQIVNDEIFPSDVMKTIQSGKGKIESLEKVVNMLGSGSAQDHQLLSTLRARKMLDMIEHATKPNEKVGDGSSVTAMWSPRTFNTMVRKERDMLTVLFTESQMAKIDLLSAIGGHTIPISGAVNHSNTSSSLISMILSTMGALTRGSGRLITAGATETGTAITDAASGHQLRKSLNGKRNLKPETQIDVSIPAWALPLFLAGKESALGEDE